MAPAATPVDVGTQRVARPAMVMALGTTLSRITGLGRILAMTFALGVTESRLADSYNLANTLPNVGIAAISIVTALVPKLSAHHLDRRQDAFREQMARGLEARQPAVG